MLHVDKPLLSYSTNDIDLPQVYFVNQKKLGKGKLGKGKANVSLFTVSGRLITDGEIDLGQVYK